jgi:hypothetical protein
MDEWKHEPYFNYVEADAAAVVLQGGWKFNYFFFLFLALFVVL